MRGQESLAEEGYLASAPSLKVAGCWPRPPNADKNYGWSIRRLIPRTAFDRPQRSADRRDQARVDEVSEDADGALRCSR